MLKLGSHNISEEVKAIGMREVILETRIDYEVIGKSGRGYQALHTNEIRLKFTIDKAKLCAFSLHKDDN